jgi:ComF family protein
MLPRLRNGSAVILRRIDEFVFPPLCIVCDKPRPDRDRWLCHACRRELTEQIPSRNGCPKCGQNLDFRTCSCKFAWDYPFSRIRSFVDYSDTVQSIMHQIKYQGKRGLAFYLGQLCSSFTGQTDVAGASIAVPIPLHRQRRRKRGFNQAEWFARGLFTGQEGITIATDVLKRVRNTKTQTKLDRSQRQINLTGAFTLSPAGAAVVAGKPVVLVDDVITTGATTAAAASVLLAGKAAGVTVVSFARD